MASPKYGGKVSTPQRYLIDILSLYGTTVKCMYGENKISHNSHFGCVIFCIRRNPNKNNIVN